MTGIYDGDMRRPSVMFPADEMASFQLQRNTYQYYSAGPHSGSGYFSACDLSPYSAQFYRPAIQRGSLQSGAYGTGNRMPDVDSVYKYNQFVFPVQNQTMREVRMASVLQGVNLGVVGGYEQQKRLIRDEYRVKGTGVFIPRASSFPNNNGTAAAAAAAPITKTKEIGAKDKPKNQVHSQKNSGNKLEKRKEVECNYQLPPELALPQEWTY